MQAREAVQSVCSPGAAGNNELLFGRLRGLVEIVVDPARLPMSEIPLVGDEGRSPRRSVPSSAMSSPTAQRIGEESSGAGRDLFAYTFEVLTGTVGRRA